MSNLPTPTPPPEDPEERSEIEILQDEVRELKALIVALTERFDTYKAQQDYKEEKVRWAAMGEDL